MFHLFASTLESTEQHGPLLRRYIVIRKQMHGYGLMDQHLGRASQLVNVKIQSPNNTLPLQSDEHLKSTLASPLKWSLV